MLCTKRGLVYSRPIHHESIQSLYVTKTYGNMFTSIIHLFTAHAHSASFSTESLEVHFSSRLVIHCKHSLGTQTIHRHFPLDGIMHSPGLFHSYIDSARPVCLKVSATCLECCILADSASRMSFWSTAVAVR